MYHLTARNENYIHNIEPDLPSMYQVALKERTVSPLSYSCLRYSQTGSSFFCQIIKLFSINTICNFKGDILC